MKTKKFSNRQTIIVYLVLAALSATMLNLDNSIVSANNYFDKSRALNGENDSPAANVELARLIAPDGMGNNGGDRIGRNAAISGNTIIVGSGEHNNSQGAAYVFVRSGENWTFQQKLVSADEAFRFGYSVAVSGDTALVGAPGATAPFNASGAVYVFTRSGTTWTQQQKIFTGVVQINQYFGSSIAMTDNTAIVGSPGERIGENSQQGAAYIYTRSGSSWGFQAKLTAADGEAGDNFGGDPLTGGDVGARRVAISGDTVVVGAAGGIFGILTGSVYVFTRNGTSWTQQQKLTAFDAAAQDAFGFSVDASGGSIIVGAPYDDIGTRGDAGSAYVFTRNGSVWTLQQKLIGEDDNPSGEDFFGTSVAISSDTALVGAPGEDIFPIVSGNGAAFLFKRTGTIWTNRAKFIINLQITPNPFAYSLGTSVALGGNTAIAGVPFFTTANGFVGAAYVFNTAAGNTPFDFDGDGRADVAVFRPSNGVWYLNQSSSGFAGFAFGFGTDKLVPADYDGDGRTDIAVYRGGTWYIQRSTLGFTVITFGDANDVPVPADYDGDGKADIAVFRPSNGVWYLNQSFAGFAGISFGQNGDRPVAADYDGDGRADVAVYRGGTWYLQRSSLGFSAISFGDSNDKPVPADYDGNGRIDVAVFRPSNGVWYLLQSQTGFAGIAFGFGTDIPAAADYDGDGKSDVAVFRLSNGTWYLNQSTNGFSGIQFGANNDRPVPSAFVP